MDQFIISLLQDDISFDSSKVRRSVIDAIYCYILNKIGKANYIRRLLHQKTKDVK